jgi:Cu+-exporting ATPase
MDEKVKNLVSGMEFDMGKSSSTFFYNEKTYYFCSFGCRDKFVEDPEKYVAHERLK